MARQRLVRFAGVVLLLVGGVCPVAGETWENRDQYSFGQRDPQGGVAPKEPLILGSDGALYGTTDTGGTFGRGVVYRFQPNDSSYVVVRHFVGGADGGSPIGSAFLQLDDGRLYGLAYNPRLVLYSLATDGSDYRIVFTFPVGAEQAGTFAHVSSLTAGPDGLIYGIYVNGGSSTPSLGTVFRVARDGSAFQTLATLLDTSSPVSFGAKGQLFGLTFATAYRMNVDGSAFTTLKNFPPPPNGTAQAEGGLSRASDGFLYGHTDRGGTFGFGTIFRLREDGTDFQTIFEPTIVTESGHFRAPMFESGDGFLYGSAGEDGFGTQSFVWRIRKNGTGWQVLRRMLFNGRGTNGMVEAPDGFLYGYTTAGGVNGRTLFRMTRDGSSFSTLHVFPSMDGFPLSPIDLVRGADQHFYGLTDKDGTGGRGTLFRIEPDGSGFTVQYDFGTAIASEQASIPKTLCAGPDGAIYGVVRQVGSNGAGVFRFTPGDGAFAWIQIFPSDQLADNGALLVGGDGLLYGEIDNAATKTARLFRLTPAGGAFTILRTFTSSTSSFTGTAALVEGLDGLLYGVTTRNGAINFPLLFRIAKDGANFSALHDINVGSTPTVNPPSGLLFAPDGRLYGLTSNVLFRSATDGTGFQTLHTFPSNTFSQRLLAGFDGKIYGAHPFGGTTGRGSIFRLSSNGSDFEEVVTFSNDPLQGQAPLGFLVTGPDGAFYGLTRGGGDANRGTLFRAATAEQIVGIAPNSLGFDLKGRFSGNVVSPPARPVDVWRSDDLRHWIFLQRVVAPELDPGFRDSSFSLPLARFYRATAP